MSWLPQVLASEFLWGTILGILLSTLTAWLGIRLQTTHQTKVVATFAHDSVANIQDFVRSLDEHRERNRVIQLDFLSYIEAEVGIFGRNREHIVLIENGETRRSLRDFFITVITYVAKIRYQLATWEKGANSTDPNDAKAANDALAEAHRVCDRLAAFAVNASDLQTSLSLIANGRK